MIELPGPEHDLAEMVDPADRHMLWALLQVAHDSGVRFQNVSGQLKLLGPPLPAWCYRVAAANSELLLHAWQGACPPGPPHHLYGCNKCAEVMLLASARKSRTCPTCGHSKRTKLPIAFAGIPTSRKAKDVKPADLIARMDAMPVPELDRLPLLNRCSLGQVIERYGLPTYLAARASPSYSEQIENGRLFLHATTEKDNQP